MEERGSVVLIEKVTFEQRLKDDKRVIQGSLGRGVAGGQCSGQEEELKLYPCCVGGDLRKSARGSAT